ncbi:helix-turn-helix transcriptional regulator [Novosphingobium sp.]|uniref:helix-turn-helix transcriptional regulator n=1 Tax=Novosphingobium sp. TaxID=1874826 RepID=UPI002733A6C6|nr:helix-turn-helix transcriptional regulator [Novosphingobium sp.]MDP3906077.1 helix-turn-helix transcriptional regulator [Novosphingobium sp.]
MLPQLTEKQREVLVQVADNRTSKEIAALLGISESAVNQRIEMIRARLGGIPRGQLARLYRQELENFQRISATFPPTWQKIQLPETGPESEGGGSESISLPGPVGSQPGRAPERNGSQLSSASIPGEPSWLTRDTTGTAVVRGVAITALILLGMIVAAIITSLIG